MKNYLFFTSEGFTYDSNNKEIQNMQILGDSLGKNLDKAFINFKMHCLLGRFFFK